MKKKSGIFKTVLKVTILSDIDLSGHSLLYIARYLAEGDGIYAKEFNEHRELDNKREVKKELKAIGNDGNFFSDA